MDNNLMFSKLNKIAIPSNDLKPSEQDLLNFEELNQVSLPKDFKDFLLRWGGFLALEEYGPNGNSGLIYPYKCKKFNDICQSIDCTTTFEGMIEKYSYPLPNYSLPFIVTNEGVVFIYLNPNINGEIYFMQRDYYGLSEYDLESIKNCEPDDACDLFDPNNNVIPYYFTKLGNSFTDFIQQLLFIDGENFEEIYDECFDADKPLDISRLIQYELPENYSSHN